MSKTAISDVVVPDVFEKYVLERTAELNRFGRSGVVQNNPLFDLLASGGGRTVEMPFWQNLSATRQLLSDSASLDVNKVGASEDIARIQYDAQAWSVNDLAKWLSGDDPMAAIVQQVADYWANIDEGLIISSLKGMFASAGMATNLLAIQSETLAGRSSTTCLTGYTFVDALQKLGDRAEDLVAVAMHSAVEAYLKKLDLIETLPASGGAAILKRFQGREVIIDDNIPSRAGTTDGTVYTTYLFGRGAFARGNSTLMGRPVEGGHGTEGVEMARVPLDSDTVLINRRRFILHPRGVKFTSSSVAGTSPTNAELETAANWTKVYASKNVPIVAVTHNIM